MDEQDQYLPDSEAEDLTDHRGVRIGLFVVIPLVIFVLVSAAIRVSQYGIDHTVIVLAQKEFVAGWPSAVRVTLMSDDGNFQPSRISCHLISRGKKHKLFDGPGDPAGFAMAVNFEVPDIDAGPAKLGFDIEFDGRRRTVDTDVVIVDAPGADKVVLPNDVRDKPLPNVLVKDKRVLMVFTEDRGAPTGLTSVVFLRTQDESGKPVSMPLEIEPPGPLGQAGAPTAIETDVLGLYALPAAPKELGWPIRVAGTSQMGDDQAPSTPDAGPVADARLHPKVIYAGLSAVLNNPIAYKGDRLRIDVRQLGSAGPLYVDLFKEGRWVKAATGNFMSGCANIEVTPPMVGLGRMQITTSALAPGKGVAVRHFYTLDENEDLNSGLRAVLKKLTRSSTHGDWAEAALEMPLETGVGFDRRQANAFSLSRLYKGHTPVPPLIHSRHSDDTELAAFKSRFQRLVMLAILLVGFGVAALIVMVAVRAHRTQQRVTMMIMAETSDDTSDGDLDMQNVADRVSTRRRAIVQGVVLFLIIMGAFVSVAILVDTLTWQNN